MTFGKSLPPATGGLVTVVVPHFNYGRYLPTAVQSALAQDVPVEVIIVDDASTDGSDAVARELADADPRVTLVQHAENMRHIRTYNDGLARARGEYVVLLSADDALAPGSLARAAALFEHDRRISLVYGRVEQFEQGDEFEHADEFRRAAPLGALPAPARKHSWWTVWDGEEWIGHFARRGRNIPTNPEVVMRRSVYDEIGGYAASLPRSADMLMWLRAAARGRIGRVNGPVQAYYRLHGANMHRTVYGGLLDDAISVKEAFELFFEVDGVRLRQPGRLAERARRAVARELALASAPLPGGEEGAHARRRMLALARDIDPGVVRSGAWRWAVFAAGTGDRTRRVAVRPVEALRWRIRSRIHGALGT
ncbi:glycosyltransferase [Microbacterium sp. NPDC096154]|uniref:glycosyltransferase n=1 Tax=Microbacterium sp. NPDC096154 TaxID=3155549 RepID=UPI00332D0C02